MIAGPAGSTLVLGPAYLDRVIRVDRPLLDPMLGLDPLDRSVDGDHRPDPGSEDFLRLVDPAGGGLTIGFPDDWPADPGAGTTIGLERRVLGPGVRSVQALMWADLLGGMGPGFAASLGGTLISALGSSDDLTSQIVAALLGQVRIAHEPVRIAGREADWTLLISSGPHGDKLAVGFRGCHSAWTDFEPWRDRPCRVRVVAALPNRVVPAALGEPGASQVRAFFPNARNMLDRSDPVTEWADRFHVLSCNRGEWIDLGDLAGGLDRVPIVAVTDGARGASVWFWDQEGSRQQVEVPAFPRSVPIVDTNRAGEAFAATLLTTLVEASWTPGPAAADLIRRAAGRASAASALVLGRANFGFPTTAEIDRAVRLGSVD